MTLTTNDDQKSRIDKGYEEGLGAYTGSNIGELEQQAAGMQNTTDTSVQDSEANPSNPMNFTGGEPRTAKAVVGGKLLKRGGFIGTLVAIVLGISGFGFFGSSLLLPNLSNNSLLKNDSRSTILERRIVKLLEKKMSAGSPCDLKKAKCRMGKMPKSMLSAMEKRGIAPVSDSKGTPYQIEGNGYANQNPYGYSFEDERGEKQIIQAADFAAEYASSPAFRKAFKKAYNMRYLGYNGKYMAKNFFNKFKIKRDGGMAADPDLDQGSVIDKLKEKLKPERDVGSEGGVKGTFRERANQLFKRSAEKVKKTGGDPILMVGSAACMALSMPRFVSGTYRAIQAAQVIALASDIIISPGGMLQAGDAKPDGVAAIGKVLTDKEVKSDGTIGKSALDSPVLQKAIGVNKNKVTVSKYAPGYSILSNPAMKTANNVTDATKGTCDVINSPQAAYAAAGIEGAVSAATLGTGAIVIGALKAMGKLAVVFGAVDGLVAAADKAGFIDGIADLAYDSAKGLIGNYVEGAQHEELGDALGTGLLTFYSSAGLVGGGAPLSTSQVSGFSDARAALDNEQRNEDVATLSPFDISSPYTFLGSIVSSLSLYSNPDNPLLSGMAMLGRIVTSPASLLSSTVSAADNDVTTDCGYAESFGIDKSVAVNSAGYPCVGIPTQYLDMSVDDVADLVADDVNEETGEPKDDGEISAMMGDCSAGDLESLKGCMITDSDIDSQHNIAVTVDGKSRDFSKNSTTVGGYEAKKRAAQSLYLFDQQVEDMLSGEDIEGSSS